MLIIVAYTSCANFTFCLYGTESRFVEEVISGISYNGWSIFDVIILTDNDNDIGFVGLIRAIAVTIVAPSSKIAQSIISSNLYMKHKVQWFQG